MRRRWGRRGRRGWLSSSDGAGARTPKAAATATRKRQASTMVAVKTRLLCFGSSSAGSAVLALSASTGSGSELGVHAALPTARPVPPPTSAAARSAAVPVPPPPSAPAVAAAVGARGREGHQSGSGSTIAPWSRIGRQLQIRIRHDRLRLEVPELAPLAPTRLAACWLRVRLRHDRAGQIPTQGVLGLALVAGHRTPSCADAARLPAPTRLPARARRPARRALTRAASDLVVPVPAATRVSGSWMGDGLHLGVRVEVRLLGLLLEGAADHVDDPVVGGPGACAVVFSVLRLGVLAERRLPVEIGVVQVQLGLVLERGGLRGDLGLVGIGQEDVPIELVLAQLEIASQIGCHGSVLTMR